MIISIAIADKNRAYVDRMSEVLQQYDDLTISVFTNAERLENALTNNKYDILLFDPDLSDEKIFVGNVKLPVCLYSDDAVNSNLYSGILNVLKYQRISNIYKEIMKQYAEKAGYIAELGGGQRTKIIAVYSPIGGSGKTLLSLAMASKFVEYGKKTLYMNCEPLYSADHIFPYQEEGNTELVAALEGDTVFELKLRGLAKNGWGGVDYIEGFQRIVDYSDVSDEEIESILKNIRKSGTYDYVIVDLGSTIDPLTKAVLAEADQIVTVNKPGAMASAKMKLFADQAIVVENQSKLSVICNFMENNSRYDQSLNVSQIGAVHNYGNLAEESIIQAICRNKEIDMSRFL